MAHGHASTLIVSSRPGTDAPVRERTRIQPIRDLASAGDTVDLALM